MAIENETRQSENIEQQSAGMENTERAIPYARFKKVISERNSLLSDLAESDVKIKELETRYTTSTKEIENLQTYKTELTALREKKFNADKQSWEVSAKVFEVKEGDKNFEKVQKVKHRFKFGDLTASEVAQNIEILKTYNEINYFDVVTNPTNYNTKKAEGSPANKTDFYGYASIEELARNDWKKAGQWLKEHRM